MQAASALYVKTKKLDKPDPGLTFSRSHFLNILSVRSLDCRNLIESTLSGQNAKLTVQTNLLIKSTVYKLQLVRTAFLQRCVT